MLLNHAFILLFNLGTKKKLKGQPSGWVQVSLLPPPQKCNRHYCLILEKKSRAEKLVVTKCRRIPNPLGPVEILSLLLLFQTKQGFCFSLTPFHTACHLTFRPNLRLGHAQFRNCLPAIWIQVKCQPHRNKIAKLVECRLQPVTVFAFLRFEGIIFAKSRSALQTMINPRICFCLTLDEQEMCYDLVGKYSFIQLCR